MSYYSGIDQRIRQQTFFNNSSKYQPEQHVPQQQLQSLFFGSRP